MITSLFSVDIVAEDHNSPETTAISVCTASDGNGTVNINNAIALLKQIAKPI